MAKTTHLSIIALLVAFVIPGHSYGQPPAIEQFTQNVETLNQLADKMVKQARRNMRGQDKSMEFRIVSRHAVLTNKLVKATQSQNTVGLREAAFLVNTNIKLMSTRQVGKDAAIGRLILASEVPANEVIKNLKSFKQAVVRPASNKADSSSVFDRFFKAIRF